MLEMLGLLCGHNSLPQIAKWGRHLDAQMRRRLGNRHRKMASYSPIRRVLLGLGEQELSQGLQGWVEAVLARSGQAGQLRSLTIDGKMLRGSGDEAAEVPALQVLNAVAHQVGVVIASQAIPPQPNELGAMPDFLDQLQLINRVVTTDALHAQRDQAETILKKGGTIYWD